MSFTALGDSKAIFSVYIEKSPPFEKAIGSPLPLETHYPLATGDIFAINQTGGNGWRKVFNVYAKLLFALPTTHRSFPDAFDSWQSFRDASLLQENSGTALYFGNADIKENARFGGLHIIAGRTHAKQLEIAGECVWLSESFAVHPDLPVFICPYFDYRQLSNIKIEQLVKLLG
ncbi:hypothetical protein CS022_01795 [Veronia nyctiphanis]|uniref:Uncharacterized protein n=2 Tax=Veronia nyctiphanis TaxID=1278244 RepID=A0A4Q0YUK9_9GAMM|nr:hypothetical protein CS022_01795 [Veronia nyctiphanis]